MRRRVQPDRYAALVERLRMERLRRWREPEGGVAEYMEDGELVGVGVEAAY